MHTLEAVAADWMTRFEEYQAKAMCDLINFVIKCTGCNLQIDLHDIEDPDNAASKLTDLQDEYHSLKITDYPLISKAKANTSFRSTLTGFFHALISTAHAAGVLYSDESLIENIQVWVSSMSSSAIRPFRHTATVISLCIGNTICGIAAEIAENIAKTMRLKDSEQKRKTPNKARVSDLQAKIADEERKRIAAERFVSDIYDTVYVNRYRDVDPKIRVECVAALGNWITTLPGTFFVGEHLRYLGWVLSDTSGPTRAEVIKQLSRFYKNKENVGRLRAFTERFRPRLVEMATRDSDSNIRAATVELLDMVRQTGLLEPDDIDTIGRLIFDTEPRVRKAVAGFFADNITDLFESAVEELGGDESINEVLGEEVDDHNAPRIAWLKFKCLAEVLQSYDVGDDGETLKSDTTETLNLSGTDSRFSLAAQAIYDSVPEVQEWETLAGYLLYDHSRSAVDGNDSEGAFNERCNPDEKQEIFLLQILRVAVKSRLVKAIESELDKKGRRTSARVTESREVQESTAIHLAQVIPQLLKKFGSNPITAAAVLRLEHILNLDIFQELRQDSTAYCLLLDDINKQFLTHADQTVLEEASAALLHARTFEDLEETTESKMQDLWDDTINMLRSLMNCDVDSDEFSNLNSTIRRIANLSGISDCVIHLDSAPRISGQSNDKSVATAHSILINLIKEYTDPNKIKEDRVDEVNKLIISSIKTLLFYNMWHVSTLQAALAEEKPLPEISDYDEFAQVLLAAMEVRSGTDPVRLVAAGAYLDLFTLFATFRHQKASSTPANIQALVQHIPSEAHAVIISVFISVEKQHANKSHRLIEPAADDSVDLNSEPEDSDDEDEDFLDEVVQAGKLLAEKQLCEIAGKMVMAIVARILDSVGEGKGRIRERLARNKAKLGTNFKDVVAYLDAPKVKPKTRNKNAGVQKKGKSDAIVENHDDDEGDEDEDEDEERGLEEGGEEDLRRKELDAVDDVTSEVGAGAGEEEVEEAQDRNEEDDDIMGD